MERATALSERAFVGEFHNEMGLCPICQEVFDLGGYGVLACSHIMHLDCQIPYEAHERGQAPNCLPECPICRARFEGFVSICV